MNQYYQFDAHKLEVRFINLYKLYRTPDSEFMFYAPRNVRGPGLLLILYDKAAMLYTHLNLINKLQN